MIRYERHMTSAAQSISAIVSEEESSQSFVQYAVRIQNINRTHVIIHVIMKVIKYDVLLYSV